MYITCRSDLSAIVVVSVAMIQKSSQDVIDTKNTFECFVALLEALTHIWFVGGSLVQHRLLKLSNPYVE